MLAMLALLSQGGLRVHELVALDVRQVDAPSATLVGVAGKGGTIVDVPLNSETLALLADWLGERASVASEREPALFVSSRGRRMSIRSVQRRVENLRVAVGTAKHVTPHTFRHTAATLALTLGCDLATVGDMLRHADLNTTRRYVHLVDERRREAVRRLGGLIPRDVLPIESAGDASIAPEHGGLDAQYPLDDTRDSIGRERPPPATGSRERNMSVNNKRAQKGARSRSACCEMRTRSTVAIVMASMVVVAVGGAVTCGCGSDSPATPGSGGSSSAGVIESFAQAVCERVTECGSESTPWRHWYPRSPERCAASVAAWFRDIIEGSEGVTWNAGDLAACVEVLKLSTCRSPWPGECNPTPGKIPAGGACFANVQCASLNCGVTGDGECGACVGSAPVAHAAPGQSCDYGESTTCDGLHYCDNGICVPRLPDGSECDGEFCKPGGGCAGDVCQPGSACRPVLAGAGTVHKCVRLGAVGDPCTQSESCGSDAACSDAPCGSETLVCNMQGSCESVAGLPSGAACDWKSWDMPQCETECTLAACSGPCATNSSGFCDANGQPCAACATPAGPGEFCGPFKLGNKIYGNPVPCEPGLYCIAGVCVKWTAPQCG